MSEFTPTQRTRVQRLAKRGNYDREIVYRILDEAFICHAGFVVDGQPYVIPTGYARADDKLYIHGSAASRMLRTLAEGVQICVTVTLLDGLVLARSAFHHSMNYRSVVILGTARLVEDEKEKWAALHAFTEHVVPGRRNEIRQPNERELKATTVLCLPLEEVSAKIRTGPPIDDEEDYQLPVWAGVLPLRLAPSAPVTDPRSKPEINPPEYVVNYARRFGLN
jgi:nitroimidazol reductase NimA-like FMN-containing flavoprotein (pyridoxamine 5'-phosphate oxidase superfamily)